MSELRGRFITLEGIDGAGKSTHVGWLAEALRARGHDVVETREPGGTALGEALRKLVLHQSMDANTEVLLMFAARREHLCRVIEPALASGQWVVCDRFTDATFAYQGGGKGVASERLAALEAWVQGGFQPDLTLLFDLPAAAARARLATARAPDKFESESEAFFMRVRASYLERARAAPGRIRVIDAALAVDEIRRQLSALLETL